MGIREDLQQRAHGETVYYDVTRDVQAELRALEAQELDRRRQIKEKVLPFIHENEELRRLDLEAMDDSRRLSELRRRTDEVVRFELKRQGLADGLVDLEQFIKEILDEALGLGPLEALLADETVDEIMVNGPDRIFVERAGKIELTNHRFASAQQVHNVIERIVSPVGRRVDESSPFVDARLERDGSRVHIIVPPLALNGPTITIRKFSKRPMTGDDLVRKGSSTTQVNRFLEGCVKGKKSVIVSGGTGTGKTTLLNILSAFIPDTERIVTIEDAAELRLSKIDLVTLEARKPNVEGKGEVTIRDLVRNALRMRPDRIVVGECRGPEALDMLQAMNTGHEGSLTTIHANTPADMLTRLENLVLMGIDIPIPVIRQNIASALSVVVQIERQRDGTRKLSRVCEVTGMVGGEVQIRDVYVFEATGLDAKGRVCGQLKPTGYKPSFLDELRRWRGIELDDSLFVSSPDDDERPQTIGDPVTKPPPSPVGSVESVVHPGSETRHTATAAADEAGGTTEALEG